MKPRKYGYISHLCASRLVQYEILVTDQIDYYKLVRNIDLKQEDSQIVHSLTMECSLQLPAPNYWQSQQYTLHTLIITNGYPLKIYCYNYPILTLYYPQETCPKFENHTVYLLTFTVNKNTGKLIKIDKAEPDHPHTRLLLEKAKDFINASSFLGYHN